jgi:hypothetical protein
MSFTMFKLSIILLFTGHFTRKNAARENIRLLPVVL